MNWPLILLVAAVLCLGLNAVGVTVHEKVNLGAWGLTFFAASFLVPLL